MPGLAGGWFWTNVDLLRSPRAVFNRVRVDPRSSARFFAVNIGVAAAANVIGFSVAAQRMWLDAMVAILIGVAVSLLVLTWIETVGLRFFARAESRRWRITPAVAWTVAHHASVGWLVGGLLMLVVWVVDPAGRLLDAQWANTFLYRRFGGTVSDYFGYIRMVQMTVPPLIGLLTFETLVYFGVRRCRFANSPASAAQQGPAEVAGPVPQPASA